MHLMLLKSTNSVKVSVMKFDQAYFQKLYARNETIDGDFNAKDHAKYLKALFDLMGYHPSSIFDFGFGKGTLLREVSRTLECVKVGGFDVSPFAYNKIKRQKWSKGWSLQNCEFRHLKVPKTPYHLGLSNSVLQYLPDSEVDFALSRMSKSCKYLYLHVPTHEDYRILKKDLKFEDPYAFQRSNNYYRKRISKYFNFVSWGLLESKKFTSHKNSIFMDSLYRF